VTSVPGPDPDEVEPKLEIFRSLPGDLAARDSQDLMAYPFFSLAKSKRVEPIVFNTKRVSVRVSGTLDYGIATIWDADVLIWAASQIIEARDQGLRTSRLIVATPYQILRFVGRGTDNHSYDRLKAAFARLQSTTVTTSIRADGCRWAA
jgi:plasmid replication initiation protein